MNIEITGKVVKAPITTTGTGQSGTWGRTVVIIEFMDGNYTRQIALESKKKYEDFARLSVGQTGTFKFDVSSREWNGRWYTTAECWAWKVDAPVPASNYQQGPI